MGTNRRYAAQIDARMSERILQRTAETGRLETLTDSELELDKRPLTRAPVARPVKAWVRFGGVPLRVDAEACSWTPRAVAIRFRIDGHEHRCWVWVGAIEGPDA
jgi:hypothetical protein